MGRHRTELRRIRFPGSGPLLRTGIAAFLALPVQTRANTEVSWDELNRTVAERSTRLEALIREAGRKNVNTEYAEVSRHVVSTFQLAARHDREHVEDVRRIFQSFDYIRKTDPAEADRLATNELKACLEVADHAMAELRMQLDGTITLSAPPDLSSGRMTLDAAYYRLDGRPVFPSSLVWMPKDEGFMQAFGRLGEVFYQAGDLDENGALDEREVKGKVASLSHQHKGNAAPLVFFLGHGPAGWMKRGHPEITQGARHFTQYDIDSPLVRDWIESLCAGALPAFSEACGDQPVVHLLANEPHFATRKRGWLSQNGLSDHTMRKYHGWLAAKYTTVGGLNEVYGTAYDDFEQVRCYDGVPGASDPDEAYRARQIDPALRGGAVWYDWCRFNMDRVNDWFTFLKQAVQANDGGRKAPVTIKTLGFTLSGNTRDGGMDIEYLTRLQDMPGADLRAAPRGAVFFGKHEEGLDPETGWVSRYAYDWVEQSMFLDFTKSLCPDKLFYDSEWHGFSSVSWRHFRMDRDYVRSALWMAFCHGMGAVKPWLWGRRSNGALLGRADHIGELSTQPIALDAFGRTLKELNAHAERVVLAVPRTRRFIIYYCEEAAIQDEDYTAGFKDIYEALKLLNLSVGFTTPSEITRLDPKMQTLIVPPTKFISDSSLEPLRAFRQAGGRVVLVGAARSFLKNEVGAHRSGDEISKPFAALPLKSVSEMVASFNRALAPVRPQLPMEMAVRDQKGDKAYGVMMSRARDPGTGGVIVVLNNVSRNRRIIALRPREGFSGACTDLITRQPVPPQFGMEPCDVRLLEFPAASEEGGEE